MWHSWDMVKKEKGQRKEKVEHKGTIEEIIDILLKDVTKACLCLQMAIQGV